MKKGDLVKVVSRRGFIAEVTVEKMGILIKKNKWDTRNWDVLVDGHMAQSIPPENLEVINESR